MKRTERPFKTCPSCSTKMAARKKMCSCGHLFEFKATKVTGLKLNEIKTGEKVKVVAGTGPVYKNTEGEILCMGYSGIFTVITIKDDGFVGYSTNGGYAYIYMGEPYEDKFTGITKRPHKIVDPSRKKHKKTKTIIEQDVELIKWD
jgi:hypothetical protein